MFPMDEHEHVRKIALALLPRRVGSEQGRLARGQVDHRRSVSHCRYEGTGRRTRSQVHHAALGHSVHEMFASAS